jgi:hypothetical protein
MPPLPKNHVRLYNTVEDIETSIPYATEDATELELVVSRFVSFARMVMAHQNRTAPFGKRNTSSIELATDLQTAMKNRRGSIVVLPMSKYFAAKMLSESIKAVTQEPAFIEMMERENRLWAELDTV